MRIGVKGRLLERIAEDNDLPSVWNIFLLIEAAADIERDTEHIKVVSGDARVKNIATCRVRAGS
jgi:hypothetical protein